MEEYTACSFTGHRIIEKGHEGKITELLDRAVAYAYAHGVRSFFSGGAIGFDTLAARAVIKFRATHPDVALTMLLPCLDQDMRWSDTQKRNYEFLLSVANEVVYLADKYDSACMQRRNRELVRRCDMLVAYCSGRRSGSSQTVSMATKTGKTVYNLYPTLENECNTAKFVE